MTFVRRLPMSMMALSVALVSIAPVEAATEIRVAYANSPGEPVDAAVHEWATAVRERSNGNMVLKPFPSSQLGGETEVMEQARFGSPLITITAYSNFMSSVPDLAVIDAPYLADDFDSKLNIFQSNWFSRQQSALVEAGYRIIVPDAVYGTRQLMTQEPIETPSDLSGMKIRVQNSPMFVAALESMGAVPTPMAFTDVYSAMAQGIVDGLENTPTALYSGRFQEVANEVTLTHHLHMVAAFVTGETFWQGLPPEDQDILVSTGEEMSKTLRALVEEQNTASLRQLEEAGMHINEVDITPFRDRVEQEMPSKFPQWSEGLYQQVSDIING